MFETTSIWGAVLRTNTLSQHQLCQCTYVQHLGSTRPWAYSFLLYANRQKARTATAATDWQQAALWFHILYLYIYIEFPKNRQIFEARSGSNRQQDETLLKKRWNTSVLEGPRSSSHAAWLAGPLGLAGWGIWEKWIAHFLLSQH